MQNFKVGDRIIIRKSTHSKTPQWLDSYEGTIRKLNNKSVTIQVDEYPNETHRVSYMDLRKL